MLFSQCLRPSLVASAVKRRLTPLKCVGDVANALKRRLTALARGFEFAHSACGRVGLLSKKKVDLSVALPGQHLASPIYWT